MGFFSYKWNKLVDFFAGNRVKVLQFVGCMFIVSCPFTIWYHVENYPNEFGGRIVLILLFMFFSYILTTVSMSGGVGFRRCTSISQTWKTGWKTTRCSE